jgi:hypothetical protein
MLNISSGSEADTEADTGGKEKTGAAWMQRRLQKRD